MSVVRPLARRYARAVFQMAIAAEQAPAVGRDLDGAARIYTDNPVLARFLRNPKVPISDKKNLLSAVLDRCGAGNLCRRFLTSLIERGRMNQLPEIAAGYADLLDEAENRAEARVSSARHLSHEETRALSASLGRITGRKIDLNVSVDPDLLGGVVVRIGSVVYDGSLRGQLDRLDKHLTER